MAVEIRYLGWTAFELKTESGRRILVDPLLAGRPDDGIPPSPEPMESFEDADLILVTHTAADHVGQAFEIMQRSKATLVCDVATRFRAIEEAGISTERIYQMISGVQFAFDDVSVKALPAQHISFARMETGFINAQPLSYVISFSTGEKIFFAGDTSIHGDLKLYGELYAPHVAMLGVGGVDVHGQSLIELFPWEAALAAKWLGVRMAIPIHYRFNEGEEFVEELGKKAPEIEGRIMEPGEGFTFRLED
jgi:L-ascorbate metabolism protein UlaG (beta-lactamase superfamily)